MTIKFKEDLTGTAYSYKKGDVVENAEEVFGAAQARYFVEQGQADEPGVKTERATDKPKTETADAK
ncbi:hypothetical protein GCM10027299_21500 [Larkinella ripae]